MATMTTTLSIETYLRTSYKPDCDFVDGQLEERHMGEYPHSKVQLELGFWFRLHAAEWRLNPLVEQRIRVSAGHVRICDVCLLDVDAPHEAVTLTPPRLCIEILSPEDRLARAALVLADYRAMGVPDIWLIDPLGRCGYRFGDQGLSERLMDRLEVVGTPIFLDLPELFKALD